MTEHSLTPWSVYAQPIASKADAIIECIKQVQATAKIDDHIYLLESEGKCPSIVGCGPRSKANAEFIITAVNAYEANQALIKQLVEALKKVQRIGEESQGVAHISRMCDVAYVATQIAREAGF